MTKNELPSNSPFGREFRNGVIALAILLIGTPLACIVINGLNIPNGLNN